MDNRVHSVLKNHKSTALKANEQFALAGLKTRIEQLYPVEQFMLFGSKARGDDHEFSDIDLLVVIESNLTSADKRNLSDVVFEINIKLNTQFSILSVTSVDFHSETWSRLPIFRIIASEGVAV